MVFIYYFLFNIMIVENFYVKFLKCKYFKKYVYVLYGIILLYNIMYLFLYVYEIYIIGIYYFIYLIKLI